jgi:GT2 family glycosyltransferase
LATGERPLKRPDVSLIVIARNEGDELMRTVENLEAVRPASAEIVVIDDGSEDGSAELLARRRGVRVFATRDLGVARARNFGASQSRGDVLVFADAHVRVDEGWWPRVERVLSRRGVGAVAPAIRSMKQPRAVGYGLTFTGPDQEVKWLRKLKEQPFEAPVVPGCFLAMKREVFDACGGWDDGLLQRGGVDNEFSVRLWLLGYRLMVDPRFEVKHLFRVRSPFPVGWVEFLHNRLRLAMVHLNAERVRAVTIALGRYEELGAALLSVSEGAVHERRRAIFERRTRNDDWYFKHFGLEWCCRNLAHKTER